MFRHIRFGLIVALSIVLLAIGAQIAYAADLTVNTTGDEVVGDGWCSLREAIRSINQGSNYGDCVATGSAYGTNDTIAFGSPGIYDLTIAGANEDASATGDLDILVPVTINGATTNGNDTIVQASIVDRVFDIFASPVTLRYLTIRKGTLTTGDGGGLRVNPDASLLLFADRVTSNSTPNLGGGIVNSGTLQLSISEVSLNSASSGGGIYNGSGAVAFLQVGDIFTNTSSADGGGLTNLGQVNSGNTWFIANTATVQGGGLHNSGTITFTDDSRILNNSASYGGGIRNFGVITMTTGSIGNNVAANGGGINNNNGTIALDFVTVSSNQAIGTGGNGYGGGIYNYGVLSIVDGSRIYSNTAGMYGGGVYHTSAGSVLDVSDSDIVSNTAFSGGGLFSDLDTRIVMTNVSVLSNTAPAYGAGIYSSGSLRWSDSSVETNSAGLRGAGLYNNISGTAIITSISFISNVVTGAGAAGGSGFANDGVMTATLVEVTANQAETCGGFDNGYTLHLIMPTISLNHASNYGGGGCNGRHLTIDGGDIISNTAGDAAGLTNGPGIDAQANLNDVTVRTNVSTGTVFGGAGGLKNNGLLTLNGGQVTSNTSAANGGGIANWNFGIVTITNGALIAYNSAVDGGGIHNTQGTLIMNGNAKVISNTASREGGGLYQSADANAQLTDVTFSLNRAQLAGGGLAQRVVSTISPLTPTLSLTNVALLSNMAVISNGGAIFNAGILTVTGSSIVSNTANSLGGGLYVEDTGRLTLSGGMIAQNVVGSSSGGLFNSGVTDISGGAIISGNASSAFVGGISNGPGAVMTVTDSFITDNVAGSISGGIGSDGALTLFNTTIDRNRVTAGPGAGVAMSGRTTIASGSISGNWAATDGGGVWNEASAPLLISGTIIYSNTANNGNGGGIYSMAGTNLIITNTTIMSNAAYLHATFQSIRSSAPNQLYTATTPDRSRQPSRVIRPTDVNGAGWGGGIFAQGLLMINGGSIDGNTAQSQGGGVWSGSSASLSGVTIRRNDADRGGGLYNDRAMSVDAATIAENVAASNGGGGLYNSVVGTLTMTQSTLDNNRAYNAAAIRNYGTLTMQRSTVSDNRTTGGNGAGLFNFNIAYLENNTFSGNVSPGDGVTGGFGGAILNSFGITTSGTLVITNVTIYSNTAAVGGGIAIASSSTVLTIKNSLVANNAGGNCDHTFGPITSLGHNLDSGNTCSFAATGDLTNTNPLVGPLLINPPGSTATHALLSGSPAINAADNVGCPAIDQRGIARPQAGVCDIGSYEAVVIDLAVTKTDTPDPVYVGRALTYTISVANIGSIPATGTILTDTLPTTVTYAASSFGGCTLITGHRVACNLDTINVGTAITFTMRVTPTVEGSIVNTATVAANETDSNLNNNTTSVATTVSPMADLTMFKTASTGIVNRNSLLTYTLHMNNNGPSVATSITVTDSLPISVTFNSATGLDWTCNHVSGSVTCTRSSLSVGAAPNILIVVTTPNVGGAIANTATIAASTFDPNAANNTDDVSVTVTTTRFVYLPIVLKN